MGATGIDELEAADVWMARFCGAGTANSQTTDSFVEGMVNQRASIEVISILVHATGSFVGLAHTSSEEVWKALAVKAK